MCGLLRCSGAWSFRNSSSSAEGFSATRASRSVIRQVMELARVLVYFDQLEVLMVAKYLSFFFVSLNVCCPSL